MALPRKATWLLAPITFLITYRLGLYLYWLPERSQYAAWYDVFAASVAYGEGELDRIALLATTSFTLALALLTIVAPGVRPIGALIGGITAALATFAVHYAAGRQLQAAFGPEAAMHAPAAAAAALLIAAAAIGRAFRKDRATGAAG